MTTFDAVGIGEETCLGVGETPADEPITFGGNCFDVVGDGGEHRRVVNFKVENLRKLLAMGLTWPLRCRALSDRKAVVDDPRIDVRWYSDRWCEVCCPVNLLPLPQRMEVDRKRERGERFDGDGYVVYHPDRKAEYR